MLGEFPTVAHNVQYGLVNFVLLWLADLNRFSIDRLRKREGVDNRHIELSELG
jgi:hypothetical protein